MASVRDLRAQMREWRRGRADTRWIDAFTDAYIAVFATIMLGSMVVNVILGLGGMTRDTCLGHSCQTARGILPWALLIATLAGASAVARLFGPAFVTPAESSWLLASPAERGGLVRPRLLRVIGAIAITATLAIAAVAGLAGFGFGSLLVAAVGLLGALLVLGLTIWAQSRERNLGRWLTWLLAGAAWLALLTLTLGWAPRLAPPTASPVWLAPYVVLGVGACLALAAGLRALAGVRRRALSAGGRLAPSISGALATLDLALLYDVLMARRWMGVEGVRPRRGGPKGPAALVFRDLVRLVRSPQALIVLAASIVFPYVAAATGLGVTIVLVSALSCFLGGLGLMSGLRVFIRSSSLARAFPFSDTTLRWAAVIVPAVLITLAGLASAPALVAADINTVGRSWLMALAAGLAGTASAVRWVTGKPPDYSRPLVSTPAGAVPTNLYGSALRGFDILILTVAPILIWHESWGTEASLVLSAIVLTTLIGQD